MPAPYFPDDRPRRTSITRPAAGEGTGNSRHSDPPHGSVAARLNAALRPWVGLMAAGVSAIGLLWGLMLTLGFTLTRPTDEMAALTARVASLERDVAAASRQQEQSAQFLHALVRAECIALRRGANDVAAALTVLPCEDVFQYWPASPNAMQSVPAPATPRGARPPNDTRQRE